MAQGSQISEKCFPATCTWYIMFNTWWFARIFPTDVHIFLKYFPCREQLDRFSLIHNLEKRSKKTDCGKVCFLTMRHKVAHSTTIKTEVAHVSKKVGHPGTKIVWGKRQKMVHFASRLYLQHYGALPLFITDFFPQFSKVYKNATK